MPILLFVLQYLVGSQVITKGPPFDTVPTIQAIVKSQNTWIFDIVCYKDILCLVVLLFYRSNTFPIECIPYT